MISIRFDIIMQAYGGYTSLYIASVHGHAEVVSLLLAGGASKDATLVWISHIHLFWRSRIASIVLVKLPRLASIHECDRLWTSVLIFECRLMVILHCTLPVRKVMMR